MNKLSTIRAQIARVKNGMVQNEQIIQKGINYDLLV